MAYVNKLMLCYRRRPGVGLRAPFPAEAEEAAKEILCEVFRMVCHDAVLLDDTLQSVVCEDLFRVKLMPVPNPAKVPPPPTLDPSLELPGGRRPKREKEQPEPRKSYKLQERERISRRQVLKSTKDCKFWHNCLTMQPPTAKPETYLSLMPQPIVY